MPKHVLDCSSSKFEFMSNINLCPIELLDVHYCWIYHCPCIMPLFMHVSIHVSSVFHQVLDYLSLDLSSTPVAYYVDFADFINAIDFNIVPLCHSNTIFITVPLSNLTPLHTFLTRSTPTTSLPIITVLCHPHITSQSSPYPTRIFSIKSTMPRKPW